MSAMDLPHPLPEGFHGIRVWFRDSFDVGKSGYPPRKGWWYEVRVGTDTSTAWCSSIQQAMQTAAEEYARMTNPVLAA